MNASHVLNRLSKTFKLNTPEILTALGVSGLASTVYLGVKTTFKAARVIEKEQARLDLEPKSHPLDFMEKTKLVWKLYIPTGMSGAFTVFCITGASKAYGRRTAAAVTAYSLTEKAFSEYKEKASEQLTKVKQQKILDDIAQDRINENPPAKSSSEIVILGPGQVLCCELRTMRYFNSDIEGLRRAQNDVNYRLNTSFGGCVSLTDFYDLIDLQPTTESDYNGWDGDDQMELSFSHGMAPDGRPCLTFDYNYVRPL